MSPNIPKTQTVAIVTSSDAPLEVRTDHPVVQPSELKPGECLVHILSTGVCHTDLHARKNDWPLSPKTPLIGGHEGVGEVVAIAEGTPNAPIKIGQRVGIKWLAYSCLDCEQCRNGLEQSCPNQKLSGFTVDGTFAQYVVSYVHHVTPIPDELPSDAAASILCAGVTVYRALKYSGARAGQWVVLPGAGGGLGHLAIQYAANMGLRVIAIDTGAEKKKLVESLGAEKWIDFKETKDIVKAVQDATGGLGPHVAVVTSASATGYQQAVDYLRHGGTLMAVGLPGHAKLESSIFWTVLKSITIRGSYVGNRQDAVEALELAAQGKVKVVFAVKQLSELSDIYEDLDAGKIAGRIVVNMPK